MEGRSQPITPIYLFPAQCFPNFKVFMNHLPVLLNCKTQLIRSWVGPRACISNKFPVLLWLQGATLLGEVLNHGKASMALSSLTPHFHPPRAGAHSPGSSQEWRESKNPLIRGEGWQDHFCPGLNETPTADSPTFRSLMWSNNCDFRLALVVKPE